MYPLDEHYNEVEGSNERLYSHLAAGRLITWSELWLNQNKYGLCELMTGLY